MAKLKLKPTNPKIDEAIVDFSLDAINLCRIMDKEENIKQALFSVSICEENGHARIAPATSGNIAVLATMIAQCALQDPGIREVINQAKKIIDQEKPLPVVGRPYPNKK